MSRNIDFKLVGIRIKEMRIRKGMNQADLADEINKTVPFISYIENDNRSVSLETLIAIANALHTTADVLLLGNQRYDLAAYIEEFEQLLSDCDSYERLVIYDTALALKNSLKQNRWHKLRH